MVAKSIPPGQEAGSGRAGRTPGIINPENSDTCCSLCSQTIPACFLLIGALWPLEIPLYIHSSPRYIHQPKRSKQQQLAYQQISNSFVPGAPVWGEQGAWQVVLLYLLTICVRQAHELPPPLPDLAETGQ